MNSEEEQEYQEYENQEYDSAFKCRYVVISNHNNIQFIHNNVDILKDKEIDELVKSTRKEIIQEKTRLLLMLQKQQIT